MNDTDEIGALTAPQDNSDKIVKAFWCQLDKYTGNANYYTHKISFGINSSIGFYSKIKKVKRFLLPNYDVVVSEYVYVNVYNEDKNITLSVSINDNEKVGLIKAEIFRRKIEFEQKALNELMC